MSGDPRERARGRALAAVEAVAVAAILGLVAVYSLRQLWDIDVFWHVVAGRVLTEQGLGVSRDTFSAIDPDRPWITIEWGYQVLTYLIDRAWGLEGLRLVHAAVQLLAFGLFYWTLRRRLELRPLVSLVLLALLVVLYADRFRARPHVFNLVLEIVLLPRLVRGQRSLDRAALAGAAVIFGLWANVHGGGALVFLCVGAAIPAAALVERLLRVPGRDHDGGAPRTPASGNRAPGLAVAWFACALLPALVSPLWLRGVVAHFTMVDASYEYTYEWHPSFRLLLVGTLPAHYLAGLFPSLVALALAFPVARVLGAWLRGGLAGLRGALSEYELHRILAALALEIIAHRSLRFVYMSAFALVIAAPLVRRSLGDVHLPPRVRRAALGLALPVLVAMGYQSRITGLYGSFGAALAAVLHGGPLLPGRFPVTQADALVRGGFEGKVFCQASWGGYLLYRLWPRAHVLADGRGNHDAGVTRDLRTIGNPANMNDPANGPVVLSIYDRYPTDVIVHQHPAWPAGYAPPPHRWVLAQSDETGSIWARPRGAGARFLEHLAAQAPPAGP